MNGKSLKDHLDPRFISSATILLHSTYIGFVKMMEMGKASFASQQCDSKSLRRRVHRLHDKLKKSPLLPYSVAMESYSIILPLTIRDRSKSPAKKSRTKAAAAAACVLGNEIADVHGKYVPSSM